MADVDQVVGDDAEADPALDAGQAFVAAAVESVASLQKADAFETGRAEVAVRLLAASACAGSGSTVVAARR